ncbi:hypothetical protein [Paenibacillus sinopodophylli]|uniref:hypothetical protein n=1 Tax=Paenibacillus sinopodophylli TaxID=1837342 RepID=UPI00110CFEBE|nr:hypothetical protein [Paenibacillus sinopodophylli]
MDNANERNKGHVGSLATERDIDPAFGLFTEEANADAVPAADERLANQYPQGDTHVHESHIPDTLDMNSYSEVDTAEEISEELAAVPDADMIAKDSPVDPASPGEEFHGTDLLNGVGNHPEEEADER